MKCPYCNKDLEITDEIEVSSTDTEFIATVTGICEDCYKRFVWDDVYEYNHSINLSEIK